MEAASPALHGSARKKWSIVPDEILSVTHTLWPSYQEVIQVHTCRGDLTSLCFISAVAVSAANNRCVLDDREDRPMIFNHIWSALYQDSVLFSI